MTMTYYNFEFSWNFAEFRRCGSQERIVKDGVVLFCGV